MSRLCDVIVRIAERILILLKNFGLSEREIKWIINFSVRESEKG
jgi:hypothetical protein